MDRAPAPDPAAGAGTAGAAGAAGAGDHSERADRPVLRSLPVDGGELAFAHWPADPAHGTADAAPVVLLHGITANSLVFTALARGLAGHSCYAPDLRGRAGSRDLPGPYGLAAHVRDLLRLLDRIAAEQPGEGGRVILVGHSMGAFVAALAAARHPERFARVLLIDGGLGVTAAPGDIDAMLEQVIGPAMRRLSMTFPDRDAYREFFRGHPALAAHWGPDVRAYVDHDLTGNPPDLHSSCALEAIRADGADVLGDPEAVRAVAELTLPAELLAAERGLLDEPAALYSPRTVAAAPVPARVVPDTNHYSILLAGHAVRAITEAVRR